MQACCGGIWYIVVVLDPAWQNALVAQWIEHLLAEQRAARSSRAEGANLERVTPLFLVHQRSHDHNC